MISVILLVWVYPLLLISTMVDNIPFNLTVLMLYLVWVLFWTLRLKTIIRWSYRIVKTAQKKKEVAK